MELKCRRSESDTNLPAVLIAPLWNWNYVAVVWSFGNNRSNRTFMELKSWRIEEDGEEDEGSNRTFMELKLIFPMFCNTEETSSNRTFMELKWFSLFLVVLSLCVLIAPLWNWNELRAGKEKSRGRVLIAPLWNWNCRGACKLPPTNRSNRTFMELKFMQRFQSMKPPRVLIAPLWNWNTRIAIVVHWARTSSNRTFMELKFTIGFNTLEINLRSNRTFMELKLNSSSVIPSNLSSSNRTFMELKWSTHKTLCSGFLVF